MKLSIILLSLSLQSVFCIAQERNLDYYYSQCPFKMPVVAQPSFSDKAFSIKDYGAVGNGINLNTEAFSKAIEACSKAGGGKVIVPPGLWLTGPITLKSNVNLYVSKGAIVQFSPDHTLYPIVKNAVQSPINGEGLENIAITGGGIIDGAGETWRPIKKAKVSATYWKELSTRGVVDKDVWWPNADAMNGDAYLADLKKTKPDATADDFLKARDFLRPYMVTLSKCKKVMIEGVTLRNSPKFIFYPTRCQDITLKDATFFNEDWAQNGDAIDISACKNVVIYHCKVSAGDDGICMKSSAGKSDAPGTMNLENILIAGCEVYHGHGGFVIGSNTDGGMNNLFVADCNFIGTEIGIRVKSNAGRGGEVSNVYLQDISMKNILKEAISFDTYYEDQQVGKVTDTTKTGKIPVFHNFHMKNINCSGAETAFYIRGLPFAHIYDLFLEDATIRATAGIKATDAHTIHLKGVKIIPATGPAYDKAVLKDIIIED